MGIASLSRYPVIAAILVVATGVAVRERPSGAIGPVPAKPVHGPLPTIFLILVLTLAIGCTLAGVVVLSRAPRKTRDRERATLVSIGIIVAVSVLLFAAVVIVAAPSAFPMAAVIAVVSVVILVKTWRAPPKRRVGEPPGAAVSTYKAEVEPLARAAELALREIAKPHDSYREAIISCFATMESALADTDFAPLPSDTAAELIDRAVSHELMAAAPAEVLQQLFSEARFSPHEMTAVHRDRAVSALNGAMRR